MQSILSLGNLTLASINVLITFSLLAYILTHNLRNLVAHSFCALLAFVSVVYIGDVILLRVNSLESARLWLKFQWIGIAFVPAAYFHFSDALLRTTNSFSRLRRIWVTAGYLFSSLLFLMAIFTELLVWDGVYAPWAVHFRAGPLFWIFELYFLAMMVSGFVNTWRARYRSLTSTSRRRMTYLAATFAAPGLGVFPYLLVASMPAFLSPNLFLLLSLAGSIGIALMTIVLAYGVAYHGILVPDRVVKHDLIRYLLQGPFVGACIIVLMLVVPQVEHILGLPRDIILIFTVASGIVTLQLLVSAVRPFVDRAAYRGDRKEITWIQTLDERLLTPADLEQLLENVLTAICNLLRVSTGFVVALMDGGKPRVEAHCGLRSLVTSFTSSCDLRFLATLTSTEGEFFAQDGLWLFPLRTKAGDTMLGILGVEAHSERQELMDRERELIRILVGQAELALEDRQLQQGIFAALQGIIPEIETIQRWRGTLGYPNALSLEAVGDIASDPIRTPEFQKWVKDALTHYWGGPRLTQSPLLKLGVVQDALERNGYSPAKALRSVLEQAIEGLRPEGQRSFTTREWILYNILEMRFIQGQRVREISSRLAVSESDLYRKQRVAVEEVAKALASMEEQERG